MLPRGHKGSESLKEPELDVPGGDTGPVGKLPPNVERWSDGLEGERGFSLQLQKAKPRSEGVTFSFTMGITEEGMSMEHSSNHGVTGGRAAGRGAWGSSGNSRTRLAGKKGPPLHRGSVERVRLTAPRGIWGSF